METRVDAALRHLVATNLVAVLFTDLSGNILEADESFLNLLGYTSKNLPRSIHDLTPPEHHRLDDEAFEKLMAFGACAPFEKEFLKQDGTQIPVLFGAALHEDEIACFVVDLSQNRQAQEKLNHLAYHDALTDLPNQVLFKDRLKQAIALSRRSDQMQAVLLLNLDRFKTINDSLGYTAGDRLLQSVAQRLSSCVRESDTVARFGGDEFAVLLTQIPRAQDAANVASAIKSALDQAFLFEDQEIFVSSSIGISLYPHDGRDTGGLLKNAGAALDRAKSLGGNVYQFYTAGGTTRALKQLVLENNLRPGLERAEFFVQYQPQVDIRGFHLVGMEALVRWQHPSLGLLYPSEFVPLAEESGLIIALGDWVMRTACAQNKAWQDAGLTPLRLSVNFSARQFQQATFMDDVAHILKETNLDPRWLELELTESSIMKEPEVAIEKLHELKLMGIKVAIDDFGTGYSSLNYLKRFPIDTLKIDKTFVSDVCKDPHDTAIVRAIINLGHALDLTVIAEGVETKEQLQYLSALECDVVQGFLFSKALHAAAFEELLIEQRRVTSGNVSATVPLSVESLAIVT
ncbi:MAG TPA: EAL domain-containing protein [Pyrinomonadaceae bacterium]|jgi:diguanylate cyclase (GGDEF)-like protein/PAS domain S-box-containing protein|nr:EAL domain-containing protein [Pyrinomonadaceae bacterium]